MEEAEERLDAGDEFLVVGQAGHCGLGLPGEGGEFAVRVVGVFAGGQGEGIEGGAEFRQGSVVGFGPFLQDSSGGLEAVHVGAEFRDVVPRAPDVLQQRAQAAELGGAGGGRAGHGDFGRALAQERRVRAGGKTGTASWRPPHSERPLHKAPQVRPSPHSRVDARW